MMGGSFSRIYFGKWVTLCYQTNLGCRFGASTESCALFRNSSQFSSVQSLSHVQLFATPWTAAPQASLSITYSQSPPKPMSFESVMPSNHLILLRPLLLLPSIFPSISVFSNESALHFRWPKYWSFSFNISPSNEYSGLISFRIDWLDLLTVQRTLKSLLQHHSSKASLLWHSAFFRVQLSHPYMIYWKNHSFDETDLCWQSNVSELKFGLRPYHPEHARSRLISEAKQGRAWLVLGWENWNSS